MCAGYREAEVLSQLQIESSILGCWSMSGRKAHFLLAYKKTNSNAAHIGVPLHKKLSGRLASIEKVICVSVCVVDTIQ